MTEFIQKNEIVLLHSTVYCQKGYFFKEPGTHLALAVAGEPSAGCAPSGSVNTCSV